MKHKKQDPKPLDPVAANPKIGNPKIANPKIGNSATGPTKLVNELVNELLKQNSALTKAKIARIESLAGDASGRRFIRVFLDNCEIKSIILMLLNQAIGPLSSAGDKYNQDDTFYESWIPGCLKRVARTLVALPEYEELLTLLLDIDYIKESSKTTWNFY